MTDPVPRSAKSVKSRLETIHQGDPDRSKQNISKVQSHFLVASNKLDKVTRRVIAPYAQIERKGLKKKEVKEGPYLDINRFNIFLEETVDLDALLYETANVLKTVTNSCGVFVYIVNKLKNEIVLMNQNTYNPKRHEVNIPIEEGKTAAAHVAATKEYLLIEDVQRDRRFAEGLRWIDAKVALCMPVVKPDGDCYAVLELYRSHADPYDNNSLYTVVSVACWAGAAVHQAQERITLQRTGLLNQELRALLQNYFCDLASIDTMLTDMLAVVKSFIGAMRSSFYVLDRDHVGEHLLADMWDDGWTSEKSNMPKKKIKVNLSLEPTPAELVAKTGKSLSIRDAHKDPRFSKEIDPTTGTVVRSCLVSPILDKTGVIGIVQLTNKTNAQPFNAEDEKIFQVFTSYCSLIVHFYNMQQKKEYYENLNKVYGNLMKLHLSPCRHDMDEIMETNGVILPPNNFKSYDYHISEGSKEDMPGLVCYMFVDTFADRNFERQNLADFTLTILQCYRNNPYHNAEHAFCFTHTMYLILANNPGYFDFVERAALMIAGLCHDLDHPGYNNNFLSLCKHPLAQMYKSSMLEYHHYFLAKKIIQDKNLFSKLSIADRDRILQEVKYNILCTDLAVYFQGCPISIILFLLERAHFQDGPIVITLESDDDILGKLKELFKFYRHTCSDFGFCIRAQLTPILTDRSFDWTDRSHRRLLKGILMTTSDLSGCCKPFGVSKTIAKDVYEEFYNQGDKERALGYTPLSMMDRRRSVNQPAEQIQFLSVVVLPCLLLLQHVLPNTSPLIDNCRKTQEQWHEEIEIRGQRLWRQDDSIQTSGRNRIVIKLDSESGTVK